MKDQGKLLSYFNHHAVVIGTRDDIVSELNAVGKLYQKVYDSAGEIKEEFQEPGALEAVGMVWYGVDPRDYQWAVDRLAAGNSTDVWLAENCGGGPTIGTLQDFLATHTCNHVVTHPEVPLRGYHQIMQVAAHSWMVTNKLFYGNRLLTPGKDDKWSGSPRTEQYDLIKNNCEHFALMLVTEDAHLRDCDSQIAWLQTVTLMSKHQLQKTLNTLFPIVEASGVAAQAPAASTTKKN